MTSPSICLLVLLPWAQFAQSTAPSPSEIIARAIAAKTAQEGRGAKYTYREDHSQSQIDKDGKRGPPAIRTYEHIMLVGEEYRKLVLIDGKPPDEKTRKKVDEDLEKTRSDRRKGGLFSVHRTVALGGLDLRERLFDNKVAGEETVLGRKTWRMESEPKQGYKARNKQEEEALASRHTGWFDQADGFLIQETSEFVRAANGFQPGSMIHAENTRIGEDWLAGDATIRADMKIMAGVHARVESHQHYYDFKRFTVDSTLTPE